MVPSQEDQIWSPQTTPPFSPNLDILLGFQIQSLQITPILVQRIGASCGEIPSCYFVAKKEMHDIKLAMLAFL